jgi:hypothetical protein
MYKIVFFVPQAYTEEVKLALFEAGAEGFATTISVLANDRDRAVSPPLEE